MIHNNQYLIQFISSYSPEQFIFILFYLIIMSAISNNSLSSSTISEIFPISVTCIKKQPAFSVCSNSDCDKYAFVCLDPTCECNLQHTYCSLVVIKNLAQVVKKKTLSLKPIEQTINKEFDDLIDKISQIRDLFITECHHQYAKYYGLESYESDFLVALQKQQVKEIRGKDIFKIQMNIKSLTKKGTHFKESHEKIKKSITKVKDILDLSQKEIQRQIDTLKEKKVVLSQSSVIRIYEHQSIIENFFQGKAIKQAKLLYRASENNFQASKFHEKCDGKNNYLVVCETQHGKILGAYTPVAWRSSDSWINDNSYQTFLFSVNKNVRFNQINVSNNMYHGAGNGPYFGSQDFHIANLANNNNCKAAFSSSFTNGSYPGNNQKTNLQILGSVNNYFKAKEWQVFQLEFA